MTPDQITKNLYSWLIAASRVDLPMGTRVVRWEELAARDPDLAARWRRGVDLFLEAIGATDNDDGDPNINFVGGALPAQTLAPDDEDDDEPEPVRGDE
jgi:hypothetical protein